jgi:putative spermidine/putrescine transport system ATP-binding protein
VAGETHAQGVAAALRGRCAPAAGACARATTCCSACAPSTSAWHEGGPGLAATVELSLPLGPQIVHDVRLADGQDLKLVESRSHGARLLEPGRAITLSLAEGAVPNAFSPTS